jgi:hypothetical protein
VTLRSLLRRFRYVAIGPVVAVLDHERDVECVLRFSGASVPPLRDGSSYREEWLLACRADGDCELRSVSAQNRRRISRDVLFGLLADAGFWTMKDHHGSLMDGLRFQVTFADRKRVQQVHIANAQPDAINPTPSDPHWRLVQALRSLVRDAGTEGGASADMAY